MSLVEVNIIGLSAQQWVIKINGIITGTDTTDLATKRAEIEALDDVTAHVLVDGIHNGDFILEPGSLQFDDIGDNGGLSYNFSMVLIEW